MDFMKHFSFIWSESLWLPENTSWRDFESKDGNYYPQAYDLFAIFLFAVVLLTVRYGFERFIAIRIGRFYKIKEKSKKVIPNKILENVYISNKGTLNYSDTNYIGLAKDLCMTRKQIERWWKIRKSQDKPCEMQRFTETSWRFLFYFIVFWYGLYILHDKPWFKDTKYCWYGYPKQHIEVEIWFYYMVELGFYVSLIFSLCTDIRRKDFWQMMIHHFATIMLMVFSWCTNFVRIGSLILCLHDIVDWWLEGAKLANYVRYSKLCDCLFVIFATLWFVTRLIVLPFWIMNASFYGSREVLGEFGVFYVCNFLLLVLLVLHAIWFCTILQMVHKFIVKGKVEKDSRSDTESETNSEGEGSNVQNSDNNNNCMENKELRLRNSIKKLQDEFLIRKDVELKL